MQPNITQVILADWTWTENRFAKDIAVLINKNGQIDAVKPKNELTLEEQQYLQVKFANAALLPVLFT
jgi:hypothetical protein